MAEAERSQLSTLVRGIVGAQRGKIVQTQGMLAQRGLATVAQTQAKWESRRSVSHDQTTRGTV